MRGCPLRPANRPSPTRPEMSPTARSWRERRANLLDVVCPARRTYPLAMAPPMAAEALGMLPATIDDLVAEVNASWPDRPTDVGVVEGAGGVASPLARDGDSASLAFRLPADLVVLVADPRLGVINLVRLCRPGARARAGHRPSQPLRPGRPPPPPQPGLARRPGRPDGHDLAPGPARRSAFDLSIGQSGSCRFGQPKGSIPRGERGRPYGLTACRCRPHPSRSNPESRRLP